MMFPYVSVYLYMYTCSCIVAIQQALDDVVLRIEHTHTYIQQILYS